MTVCKNKQDFKSPSASLIRPLGLQNLKGKTLLDYKKKLQLNDLQKDILIGTLLGDASMSLSKGKPVYGVKFEQGLKNQAYIDYLYEIFKPYTGSAPSTRFIDKEKSRQAI